MPMGATAQPIYPKIDDVREPVYSFYYANYGMNISLYEKDGYEWIYIENYTIGTLGITLPDGTSYNFSEGLHNEVLINGTPTIREDILYSAHETIFPAKYDWVYVNFYKPTEEIHFFIDILNKTNEITAKYFLDTPYIPTADVYYPNETEAVFSWAPIDGATGYVLINETVDIDDPLPEPIINTSTTELTLDSSFLDYGDLYIVAYNNYTHSKSSNPLTARIHILEDPPINNTEKNNTGTTNATISDNSMILEVNGFPIVVPIIVMAIIAKVIILKKRR